MIPRTSIDMPIVEPTRKRSLDATASTSVGVKDKIYKSAVEWRGPCCSGSHWWGHGGGHKAQNGGRVYKCGECKQVLTTKLCPAEQKVAKKEACENAIIAMTDSELAEVVRAGGETGDRRTDPHPRTSWSSDRCKS